MEDRKRKEKETTLLLLLFVTNQPYVLFPFKKKIIQREIISIPLARIFPPYCTHAWMHAVPPLQLFHRHLGLFLSLCRIGSIHGDAVSGLSGRMLPFANQDRSTARGEPGQRAVQIGAVKDGTAADMVEGSFLPLRAQETADHTL